MILNNSAKNLAEILGKTNSSQEMIDEAIGQYYEIIKQTDETDAVERSMQHLSSLFGLENLKNGALASLICGSLIEHDFSAKYITDDFIAAYLKIFNEAKPFLDVCDKELDRIVENEIEEEDYEVVERLEAEFKDEMKQEIYALKALDKYYSCGISIFSSTESEFLKGKQQLTFASKYAYTSIGLFWLAKLFEVQFNEPVTIIDLNTKKGITGSMSGIVDNFQLQLILMGMEELNEEIGISQEFIDIVTGYGQQSLNNSVSGKWDMCNWEYLKDKELKKGRVSDDWIWSEGNPNHISKYNGKRVILLDKPSYSRGIQIQRTFKNLKAQILVDNILSVEEVNELLDKMRLSANTA